jgi:hypothetical protein
MEKLVLDYSKWRCGSLGHNALGEGCTRLLNTEGYQCCLGQWCSQIGVPESSLLNRCRPADLNISICYLTEQLQLSDKIIYNTSLAKRLMLINDNTMTTPFKKIKELEELLSDHNIKLEVINLPENEQRN